VHLPQDLADRWPKERSERVVELLKFSVTIEVPETIDAEPRLRLRKLHSHVIRAAL
jgi:hypothetical protein